MAKIYGDQENIKYAKSAPAGARDVYVNMDAINDLPEEYEATINCVEYDPKRLADSFSNVGTDKSPSWMPKPEFMYKVAEACGINGSGVSEVMSLIEEVDINPMLCKPIDAVPNYQRKNVGRSVSKQSSIMMEDGSLRFSSLCTAEYNVWERCCEAWSKEEMYTEGYAKSGKFGNKYETSYQRRSHFDSEMKFAHAKAESKAYLKTIRELAGMPTGFQSADLTSGKMLFARIRRSKAVLKMETAARISAMSRGIESQPAKAMLFGPAETEEIAQETVIEQTEPIEDAQVQESQILAVFREYMPSINDEAMQATAKATIEWLEGQDDPEANKAFYAKALKNLRLIEDGIPEAFRLTHTLFE